MANYYETLLARALRLSDRDRAELPARLIDSLDEGFDEDVEQAWQDEIARHVAEVEAGTATLLPSEEVERQIMELEGLNPETTEVIEKVIKDGKRQSRR